MNSTALNHTIGLDSLAPLTPRGNTAAQATRSEPTDESSWPRAANGTQGSASEPRDRFIPFHVDGLRPTAVDLYREWGTSLSEVVGDGMRGLPVTKVIWSDGREQLVSGHIRETMSDVMDILESKGVDGEFTLDCVGYAELVELQAELGESEEQGEGDGEEVRSYGHFSDDQNRDYRYCF